MIPNIERGTSFKGVTAYLMHDKREGECDGTTAERVGFTHVLNFIGDEARNPEEAAKLMALTVRDADIIKAQAGIKPGGRKAEKPPVWHTSLSWHPSETVTEADMMKAVEGCLSAVGLDFDKGFQTFIVQHTDEPQAHVHIVVNLVHPITGKQANPYRDLPKAQEWGRTYDKARGTVFAHDREAKYAALDAARSNGATSAIFNDRAKGGPSRPPSDRQPSARPKKGQQRPEWEARNARYKEAQEAADRVKAENDGPYHEMRKSHDEAYQARRAEIDRAKADSQTGKDAIYQKYKFALDAIWKPEPSPKQASPEMETWRKFGRHMDARKQAFEMKEQSFAGRLENARVLLRNGAAGKRSPRGLVAIIRLALNHAERKRLFEREQRRTFARLAPPKPARLKERPRPVTPEPKRVQAERLKAMRAVELAAYARFTRAAAASMEARHHFQQQAEQARRAAFTRDSKAAWAAHRAKYPYERAKAPEAAQERKADRPTDKFGRSRDREPRAPRQGRGGVQTDTADKTKEAIDGKAENLTAEADQAFTRPESREAPETHRAQDAGQGGTVPERQGWTPEERAAAIQAEREARELREAKQAEEGKEFDPGREMGP
jgi:hypothetical protein